MIIYNRRLAAVFKYLSLTVPRYSISNDSGSLLEKELAEKYLEMWENVRVVIRDSVQIPDVTNALF